MQTEEKPKLTTKMVAVKLRLRKGRPFDTHPFHSDPEHLVTMMARPEDFKVVDAYLTWKE